MTIEKNFFGHRVTSDTSTLDDLFLASQYTVTEIADCIGKSKSRVMNHVKHLQNRKMVDVTVHPVSKVVSMIHPLKQGRTNFNGSAMVRSFCKSQNKKTQRFDALSILSNR